MPVMEVIDIGGNECISVDSSSESSSSSSESTTSSSESTTSLSESSSSLEAAAAAPPAVVDNVLIDDEISYFLMMH
eukprot:13600081-Heterocapsa_arctica.AAC.1